MTPETATVVVYLLQYVWGVPPQPFSIVSIPNLPSLEECTYLAHELMPGVPEPKFRCIRYQTAAVTAAPPESVAAVPLPTPRPLTWKEDRADEDNASPVPALAAPAAPVGLHDHDPEACAAGASECPVYWKPDPNDEPCASGGKGCILPDTWEHLPNHVRIPRTKIEHEFGTLFGTMPRDGRAAPLNELGIAMRSTIFRVFVLPDWFRRS